jgi:hypothetical protein
MGNYHGTAGGGETLLDGEREREITDEERVSCSVGVIAMERKRQEVAAWVQACSPHRRA